MKNRKPANVLKQSEPRLLTVCSELYFMPVNAPIEYYKAEEKFKTAKNKEDKIAALEEMMRLLPKHHGSENAFAQLKAKMARLKKESDKKGARKVGIQKEGEAQVCLIGFTNTGKSSLLKELTRANPKISEHKYTTTKPEIGMMDYKGVKVQLVEIPSTFDSEYMSIARSSDGIALVVSNAKEKQKLEQMIKENFIRVKHVFINPHEEDKEEIREKIWKALGLMVVYTKKTKTPMALPIGSTALDFAKRIHKDFVTNFRFARLWRAGTQKQIGLNYVLQDEDIVEIHTQ